MLQMAMDLEISEEGFKKIIRDPIVKDILDDLDVDPLNRGELFEILDPDENGTISTPAFLSTVLKTRGEPKKGDIVMSMIMIEALMQEGQQLEKAVATAPMNLGGPGCASNRGSLNLA